MTCPFQKPNPPPTGRYPIRSSRPATSFAILSSKTLRSPPMADAPKRIQLRRTKGWRMPDNTVKVDRSTRWGNPWPIGKEGPFGLAGDAVGPCYFFAEMFRDPELLAAAEDPADLSPLRGQDPAWWG